MTRVDHIWHQCRLATLSASRQGLGLVDDGLIAATDGRIVYAGPAREAPSALDAKERTDCAGRWITPGLIDCHTHLVYGGNRAQEFEQRLAGASYEEIAHAGGGIVSTVKATRQASVEQLVEAALPRLDALIAEGVTTIEIKSGYGLELDTERRQLQAARRLGSERAVAVRTTFWARIPFRLKWQAARPAISTRCATRCYRPSPPQGSPMRSTPSAKGSPSRPSETAQVFAKAQALGPPASSSCRSVSNLHGAALAARFGALSADHLEYADEDGIAAMARGRHRRCGSARRLLLHPREATTADRRDAASWRGNRARHR